MYLPYGRFGGLIGLIGGVVHTVGDPATMTAAIHDAIWEIDPNLPIDRVVPMTARVSDSMAQERFLLTLLTTFSALALVLATAGVYGTFTYLVRRRNREMGIRRAIGASGRQVVRLIVQRGLILVSAGLVIGIVGTFWLVRILEGVVFGVSMTDPLTIGSVGLILAVVALIACLFPAIRASRVDPLEALRVE